MAGCVPTSERYSVVIVANDRAVTQSSPGCGTGCVDGRVRDTLLREPFEPRRMPALQRIVIDLLKPHEPSTIDLARHVAELDGVAGVNATLIETDREVQNVKLTVEGDALEYDALEAAIEDLSGTVHSVDQVVCGDRMVESVATPQD